MTNQARDYYGHAAHNGYRRAIGNRGKQWRSLDETTREMYRVVGDAVIQAYEARREGVCSRCLADMELTPEDAADPKNAVCADCA